jgi:hypothetical protein
MSAVAGNVPVPDRGAVVGGVDELRARLLSIRARLANMADRTVGVQPTAECSAPTPVGTQKTPPLSLMEIVGGAHQVASGIEDELGRLEKAL